MIDMSGVPEGTTFSAGTLVDCHWIVSADAARDLSMTVPAGAPAFTLTVSATSAEASGGDSRTTPVSLEVDAARQAPITVSAGGEVATGDDIPAAEVGGETGGGSNPEEQEPAAWNPADSGKTDQGEASTVDPVQLYQEFVAGFQGPEADADDYLTLVQTQVDDAAPAALPGDAAAQEIGSPVDTDYTQFAAGSAAVLPDQVEVAAGEPLADDLPAFEPLQEDAPVSIDLPDLPLTLGEDDQNA
ncbi:MAG: hypothetical protein ACOYJQ_17355 [Pseudochelatococcus sp.]|jgi:hypothetical protein|uniref:hypothetical protein n=1 Tax=Pseudochelatococcus sp. TaxID=2020869 RepID=UPI003D8F711E